MNESTSPNWVPPSLVRLRCFLNRRGMKVKPWLGPEAVLEAFYAALRSQAPSDAFWGELQQLLSELASDMNQRVQGRGWVIENELLDSSAHAELLAQIREALGIEAKASAGLHPLVSAISPRAGALLLMLAAAIVIGCGGQEEAPSSNGSGGTYSTQAPSGGNHATTTSGGAGTTSVAPTGGSSIVPITLPANGGASQGTTACPSPDANSAPDPAKFAACNPKLVAALIPYAASGNSYQRILSCACLLNDAWQTGLGDLFAGQSCDQILAYFGDCGIDNLCGSGQRTLPENFDANALYDRCMVLIYLGVRCD